MKKQLRLAAIASLMIVGMSAVARAQTATDAGTALKKLIGLGFPDGDSLVPAVFNLIQTEVATFPTASSSAGFTYAFDRQFGIPVLATASVEFRGAAEYSGPRPVRHEPRFPAHELALARRLQSEGGGAGQDRRVGLFAGVHRFANLDRRCGHDGGPDRPVDVGVSVPYITTTASGTYDVRRTFRRIGDGHQRHRNATLRARAHVIAARGFRARAAVEEHRRGMPTRCWVSARRDKLLVIAEEHGDKVSHHLFHLHVRGRGAHRRVWLLDISFGQRLRPSDGSTIPAAWTSRPHRDDHRRHRRTRVRHGANRERLQRLRRPYVQNFVPHDRRTLLVGVASVRSERPRPMADPCDHPVSADRQRPRARYHPVIGFERVLGNEGRIPPALFEAQQPTHSRRIDHSAPDD
jgi:hypothetical protein